MDFGLSLRWILRWLLTWLSLVVRLWLISILSLQEVVSLLREPCWRADIVHAYREVNRCADFLAKKGHLVSSYDWAVLESVCPGLGILLADDVRGSVLPR